MGSNQPISRRNLFHKATLGTLAAGAFTGPFLKADPKFKWKMVTTWPTNFPALGTGAARLAARIGELSGGQIDVKVYGAGELVPALGVFDAVSRGTAQLGHGASYYWKGKHEAAQFFAAVPFGLTAQEMNGWLYYGGGHALWQELYDSFQLVPFPAGNTGVQMGGWFRKPIKSANDFKGLKMRMPGLGGDVIKELGATVVNLAGGDIFQALKTGTIDATEWVGPYNDLAFGLHQTANYYYWPGWQEPGSTLECLVNKQAYASLPKELQQIVASACQAANLDILSEFTARNSDALDTLVTKHKVKLERFPKDLLQKLEKTSSEVMAAIAAKDPFSKKVYQSFMKFKRQAIGWSRISEEGFTLARTQ